MAPNWTFIETSTVPCNYQPIRQLAKQHYADLQYLQCIDYLGKHLVYCSVLTGDAPLWVRRVCVGQIEVPDTRNQHQVKLIEQALQNSAHTWQIRDVREVHINLNWNGTHSAVNFILWCQEDLQLQWTVSTLPYLQQEHSCLLWAREGIPCSIATYYYNWKTAGHPRTRRDRSLRTDQFSYQKHLKG